MPPTQTPQKDSPDYDFILQAEDPIPKHWTTRINKNRLIIFAIIFGFALIIFTLVMSSLNAQKNEAQTQRLIEIVQMQKEISRVAALGVEGAVKPAVKDRAEAIQKGMDDSAKKTLSLLAERGISADDEKLTGEEDTAADEALTSATEFATFDKTFDKLIDAKIVSYQRALLVAEKNGNNAEMTQFQTAYSQADSMLGLVDVKQ